MFILRGSGGGGYVEGRGGGARVKEEQTCVCVRRWSQEGSGKGSACRCVGQVTRLIGLSLVNESRYTPIRQEDEAP